MVKILCDRAVWIYKGKLRLDGDPTYVISKYLEQSAIDNKEEAQKEDEEEEKGAPQGAAFLDQPAPFQVLPLDENLHLIGWAVSDSLDEQLEIRLDDRILPDIARSHRDDVFDAYKEDYAGFIDVDTVGFEKIVDKRELTEGTHRIEVILRDGKTGRQIDHKTIRIKIDKNAPKSDRKKR